jgi:hypothetical protein
MTSRLAAVLFLFCAPAFGADVAWTVSGEWLDTCNCANPCPCWVNEKPTLKDCQDLIYFHVEKGRYGDVVLDGADLVGVSLSPPDSTMGGAAKSKTYVLANLYLSDKLSPEVAQAMETIFTRYLVMVPQGSAKTHAVKHVAMQCSLTAEGARVSIPDVLELDVRRTQEPFGRDTSKAKFSGKSVSGEQKRYDFSDDGISWKLSGRNASFAPFSLASK